MQVPRAFVEDFELVAKHYGCPPDEVELMKAAARVDMANAQLCFAVLAEEIHPERGVNRRMRAGAPISAGAPTGAGGINSKPVNAMVLNAGARDA